MPGHWSAVTRLLQAAPKNHILRLIMSYTSRDSVPEVFQDPALSDTELDGQSLCILCRSITISGIRRVFIHHKNHKCLLASARSCDCCALLSRYLTESPLLRWSYENDSRISTMRGRISESFNEIVGTSFSAVRIRDSRTRPEGSSPDDANRHGLNQIWITCDSLNQELRMYATSGMILHGRFGDCAAHSHAQLEHRQNGGSRGR